MKIQKIKLRGFKRFHNLVIDLGAEPKKIVALVGPNGCGKSSIFDAFEVVASYKKGSRGSLTEEYMSKSMYSQDIVEKFDETKAVEIIPFPASHVISKKSFIIRSSYRFSGNLNITNL